MGIQCQILPLKLIHTEIDTEKLPGKEEDPFSVRPLAISIKKYKSRGLLLEPVYRCIRRPWRRFLLGL
jgi:hypothetical protein